jgi:hypothetical protein
MQHDDGIGELPVGQTIGRAGGHRGDARGDHRQFLVHDPRIAQGYDKIGSANRCHVMDSGRHGAFSGGPAGVIPGGW